MKLCLDTKVKALDKDDFVHTKTYLEIKGRYIQKKLFNFMNNKETRKL